jgi:hypothetical protein
VTFTVSSNLGPGGVCGVLKCPGAGCPAAVLCCQGSQLPTYHTRFPAVSGCSCGPATWHVCTFVDAACGTWLLLGGARVGWHMHPRRLTPPPPATPPIGWQGCLSRPCAVLGTSVPESKPVPSGFAPPCCACMRNAAAAVSGGTASHGRPSAWVVLSNCSCRLRRPDLWGCTCMRISNSCS